MFKRLREMLGLARNKPDRDLFTPNWGAAGQQAALKAPAAAFRDDLSNRRALEAAFEAFYQSHQAACRKANLTPAIPKVVMPKFQAGWEAGKRRRTPPT